jgi:hypothetical protein
LTLFQTSGDMSAGPSEEPHDEDEQPEAADSIGSAGAFNCPRPRMPSSEITLLIARSFPKRDVFGLDKAIRGPNSLFIANQYVSVT